MIGDFEPFGDGVIVHGEGVVTLFRVLRHAQRCGGLTRVERADRIDALERATRATLVNQGKRHRDIESPCTGVEFLSARQAAERLGVNIRTAQRLAPQLNAERRGGVWQFPAESVEAAAAERQHTEGSK